MSSLNKIMLIGRLGNDPELKEVGSSKVAKFSLATSEKYKTRDGEKREDTTWHHIEVWGNMAEVCAKYLSKGSQCYVEGVQQHRKHEDKYYASVKAFTVTFLDSKNTQSKPVSDGDDDLPY